MSDSRIGNYTAKVTGWIERFPSVVFILWAILCSFPYWILGNDSYVRIFDNADSTLAAKLGLADSIARYGFTFWWNTAVSGADTVAQAVAGEADTLLFFLFPGWLAYGSLMFLQRFIAGYFMYRFARQSLRLQLVPGIFAGLAYALFAQLWLNVSWNGFTTYDSLALPSLPLVLLSLHSIIETTNKRKYLWAVLLGAFFSLASYFVFTFFIYPVIVYWLLWITGLSFRKAWKPLFAFTLSWALFELPAQIPALLNAPLSHRADWTAESLWYGWTFQFRLVWNSLSQNALPAIIAVAAIALGGWKHRKLGRVIALLALVYAAVLTLPYLTSISGRHIGILKGVSFMRTFLNLPFLLIIAGAIGLDALFLRLRVPDLHTSAVGNVPLTRRIRIMIIPVIGVIVFLVLVLDWVNITRKTISWWVHGSSYSALYRQPQIEALAASTRNQTPYRIATIVPHGYMSAGKVALMPLFNSAYAWQSGLESADGYVLMYPQRYQDYWELVMQPLFLRNSNCYNRFHSWGSQVYLFYPINEIVDPEQSIRFDENYNLNLLSLLNVRFIVSNFRLEDHRLKLVSDGSAYLKRWFNTPDSETLFAAHIGGNILQIPLFIYENPECLPRYYLVPEIDIVPAKADVLGALSSSTVAQLKKRIVASSADFRNGHRPGPDGGTGTVQLHSYTPGEARLRTDTDGGSYLVISANYSPHWKAFIDERQTALFPANEALQAVYIPSGSHEVRLKYDPPYAF